MKPSLWSAILLNYYYVCYGALMGLNPGPGCVLGQQYQCLVLCILDHQGTVQKYQYCWVVDPLDGTKEFIKRVPHFTVNIALIKGQVPVMGVVYTPAAATTHFAVKGQGAFVRCVCFTLPYPLNITADQRHRAPAVQLHVPMVPNSIVGGCRYFLAFSWADKQAYVQRLEPSGT